MKLKGSEVHWHYIHLSKEFLKHIPRRKTVKMSHKERTFEVTVNRAGRIVSKRIFEELKLRESAVLKVTKKSEGEFTIVTK